MSDCIEDTIMASTDAIKIAYGVNFFDSVILLYSDFIW